jgi:hypothetical protein
VEPMITALPDRARSAGLNQLNWSRQFEISWKKKKTNFHRCRIVEWYLIRRINPADIADCSGRGSDGTALIVWNQWLHPSVDASFLINRTAMNLMDLIAADTSRRRIMR